MAEVRLEGVTKSFGSVTAVSDVSLVIEDGDFFSLLGPSGCGKSTLLNTICGLETNEAGRILIDGVDVSRMTPKRRGIAMVFQDYALYPHMTVAENLSFPLKADKWSKPDIESKVGEVSEPLELTELLARYPRELSGGQRQRVALGRALVRDPKVFLMDEPLSNLDARLRIQMRTELRLLQDRLAATVIYVTHDQAEAMTLSDRMAVMSRGSIQQVGAPIDLYDRPDNLFVAGFLGDIGMNVIEGKVEAASNGLVWSAGALEYPLGDADASLAEGYPVTLGAHPEDVVRVRSADDAWVVGTLLLREQFGSEQHLHVDLGDGRTLVSRAAPHVRLEPGDRVPLSLREGHVHFFETASGRAISQVRARGAQSPSHDVDTPRRVQEIP